MSQGNRFQASYDKNSREAKWTDGLSETKWEEAGEGKGMVGAKLRNSKVRTYSD